MVTGTATRSTRPGLAHATDWATSARRRGKMADGASTGWRVEPDADDASAYAVLAQDRLWNGFGLADLAPPLRAFSRVALARRTGAKASGRATVGQPAQPPVPAAALLVLRPPAFPAPIPHGD